MRFELICLLDGTFWVFWVYHSPTRVIVVFETVLYFFHPHKPGMWISLWGKSNVQGTTNHHQQKPQLDSTTVLFTPDLHQCCSFKQTLGDIQRHQNTGITSLVILYLLATCLSIPVAPGLFCGRCKIRTCGTLTGSEVFKTSGINQLSQPSRKCSSHHQLNL